MYKIITEDDHADYENYILSSPRAHFLQSVKWAAFKSDVKSVMIASLDSGGKIRGVCGVYVYPTKMLKKAILYAPRGPIFDSESALSDIIDGVKAVSRKYHGFIFICDPDIPRGGIPRNRGLAAADNGIHINFLQPKAVYRIDVAGKTDEELISAFHSKARYSLRAAQKSGLTSRMGGKDDLPEFCRLLTETAERDGFTPRPLPYFEKMYDALGCDFHLFLVEYEGALQAGGVLISYGDKTWHLYGGSSADHRDKMPNFLLQWDMIKWSVSNGYRIYDMRGIAGERDKNMPLEGLERFKKRFGGELCVFEGQMSLVTDGFFNCLYNVLYRIRRKR